LQQFAQYLIVNIGMVQSYSKQQVHNFCMNDVPDEGRTQTETCCK